MTRLTPIESRVLGVLVEKAQTVQSQYPLTLNALVTGCNQKSNRDPELNLTENDVQEALDGLRGKNLVREVHLSGSRVPKYRHVARETLNLDTAQLVLLAELLLRGPQTLGELRNRATRMHPLESLDVVEAALDHLMSRDEPLVRRLPAGPGSRADRYAQLLCPDLHSIDAPTASAPARPISPASPDAGTADLLERVQQLEAELCSLRDAVRRLTDSLGDTTGA